MRVTPNIELSGINSFWYTCLITKHQSQGRKTAERGEFVRRTPQHQEDRDSLARQAKEGQSGSSYFVYHVFEGHATREISQTVPLLQTFLL